MNSRHPFSFLMIAVVWYGLKLAISTPGSIFGGEASAGTETYESVLLSVSPVFVYAVAWAAYLVAGLAKWDKHSIHRAIELSFAFHCVWIAVCVAAFFSQGTGLSSFNDTSLGSSIMSIGEWLTPVLMGLFLTCLFCFRTTSRSNTGNTVDTRQQCCTKPYEQS